MQITGLWLAARTHGSGIAIVEKLAFLPGELGTYAVYDWTLQYYDTFTWKLAGEDRISIVGGERFFRDSQSADVLSTDSRFDFDDVPFSITSYLPEDDRVDVLRIELGPDYSNTFFRSKDPIAAYEPPSFEKESG
jgi:hypothetical protein